MELRLENIGKKYDDQWVLQHQSILIPAHQKVSIVGHNGAGKSTLLQLIAGYITPTQGNIIYTLGEKNITREEIFHYTAYCAPYIELIEEMTLLEFLDYHFSFKKTNVPINTLLHEIGLYDAKDKIIAQFSSGMKQRVKLAQAIYSDVPLLLLDEPCSNLDEKGIELYQFLIQKYTENKTVIVASNNYNEYHFCTQQIDLNAK